MRRLTLAFIALGFAACNGGSQPSCTLDGAPADRCLVIHDGAGFSVVAYRGHASLELDTPLTFDNGATMLPGDSMLESTDASGVTCDAASGSAVWGVDGDQWCLSVSGSCGAHWLCLPLKQFNKEKK